MKLNIYDNFLSNDEVTLLINDLNNQEIKPYLNNYKKDETSISFEMPSNLTGNVRNCFNKLKSKMNITDNKLYNNTIRVRRYKENESHPDHTDYYFSDNTFLVESAIIYLNDIEKGGETVFPNTKTLKEKNNEDSIHHNGVLVENTNDKVEILSRKGRLITWDSGNNRGDEYKESLHYSVAPINTERIVLLYFKYVRKDDNIKYYINSHNDDISKVLKKRTNWNEFPSKIYFTTNNKNPVYQPKYNAIIDYCDIESQCILDTSPNYTSIINNKYNMCKYAQQNSLEKYIPFTRFSSNGIIENNAKFEKNVYFVKEDIKEARYGIRITKNPLKLKYKKTINYVIQNSVKNPLLINGCKTSCRFFIIIERINNKYILYVYNKAYIIISDNIFNKKSIDLQTQCQNDWHCVNDKSYEVKYGHTYLLNDFKDLPVNELFISMYVMLSKFLKNIKNIKQNNNKRAFALFAVDIIFCKNNNKFKPIIMEFNFGPGISSDNCIHDFNMVSDLIDVFLEKKDYMKTGWNFRKEL